MNTKIKSKNMAEKYLVYSIISVTILLAGQYAGQV